MYEGSLVYVVDEESRLARREVTAAFTVDEYVAVASGLEPGDRVVTSDPIPAIPGMLLDPALDEGLEARIAAAAGGGTPAESPGGPADGAGAGVRDGGAEK